MTAPPGKPILDLDALEGLLGRSVLQTTALTSVELTAVLDLAQWFARHDYDGGTAPLFAHELAYAIFFDNSTRTKSAWAGAAARLGMQPVIVDGSSTQVAHGETASETGAMLGMNAHALGVRHDLILGEGNRFMQDVEAGINDYLGHTDDPRKVPVVNLQCDIDHPTQTLADAVWLREHFGADGVAGKKIAVTWAYSPSYAKPLSVPQGLAMLLPRLGADVVVAHPPGYRLIDPALEAAQAGANAAGGSFQLTDDMDAAFADADVVYPKSWGPYDLMLQRVAANRAGDSAQLADIEAACLSRNADYQSWICDERRMALTKGGDALYMHCLPADIGDEVSPGVMKKHRINVAREANKKVFVIMALLATAKAPDLADRLALL